MTIRFVEALSAKPQRVPFSVDLAPRLSGFPVDESALDAVLEIAPLLYTPTYMGSGHISLANETVTHSESLCTWCRPRRWLVILR